MNSDYTTYLKEEGYSTTTASKLFGRKSTLGDGTVEAGGYQEATSEQLFGHSSYRVECEIPQSVEPTFSSEPLFQFLVVGFVVVYMYMVLRAWHFIGSLWRGVIDYRRSEQKMTYAGGALPLSRFKLTAAITGAVAAALVLVRFMDIYLGAEARVYGQAVANFMPLIILLVIGVVVLWIFLLHTALGWVTRSANARELATVGYITVVRTSVAMFVPTAVWLVADGLTESIVGGVLITGLILFAAIYLKDTFMFFLEKKVSIFNWFLYLCTAILLPVSFLAALLSRILG